MPSTRDWEKVKLRYVSGEVSLRELADEIGVAYSALSERAAAEGWTDERDHFRVKTGSEATDIASEKIAKAVGESYAERRISDLQLANAIINRFWDQMDKKNITVFDAVNTARFRRTIEAEADGSGQPLRGADLDREALDLGIDPEKLAALLGEWDDGSNYQQQEEE